MNNAVSCDCCEGQVRWIQHNQLSHNRFFCIYHAKLEQEFGEGGFDIKDWEEVYWSVPKKHQANSGALKAM